MTFLLPLDALLYTVPALVPMSAEITIRQLAIGCIFAALILYALREGWNYWKGK